MTDSIKVPVRPGNLAKGQDTAKWVLETITAFPDGHDQATWEEDPFDCGTSRCVGGWALYAHGVPLWPYLRSELAPSNGAIARDLLGLSHEDADILFFQTSEEGAVEALRLLAAGKPIAWQQEWLS